MSSGEVKNQYTVLPTLEYSSQLFYVHRISDNQKNKFEFISIIISFLFDNNKTEEHFEKISNLMTLVLAIPSSNFKDLNISEVIENVFKSEKKKDPLKLYEQILSNKNQLLCLLNKIRLLFNNCSDLNSKEKFDFCSLERFFMKQYLNTCIQ